MHKNAHLSSFIQWIIIISFALIPLFFLPVTEDFYETNKWYLLVFSSLTCGLVFIVNVVRTQVLEMCLSRATIALFALFVSSILSLIFASSNRVEALLSPYGPITFFSLMLIFLCSGTIFGKKEKDRLYVFWTFSSFFLSLVALYQFFGMGKLLSPWIKFLSSSLWTPSGSSLGLIGTLAISLMLVIQRIFLILKLRQPNGFMLAFSISALLIILGGIIVTLIQIYPLLSSLTLPFRAGWTIMINAFKSPGQALFGVGAENFLKAFTQGRPVELNGTPIWNLRFTTNSSLATHIGATLGIFGGFSLFLYLSDFFRANKPRISVLTGIVAFVILSLIPPNFSFFISLAVSSLLLNDFQKLNVVRIRIQEQTQWIAALLCVGSLVIILGAGALLVRSYKAEIAFFESLQAINRHDGNKAFSSARSAIFLNPYIYRYRIKFSQINLELGNAVLFDAKKKIASRNAQVPEDARKKASDFIQESISQGKHAIRLATHNVLAWENMAGVYESLIDSAVNSDKWAIASYKRAIQIDPTNPVLWSGLGGVYLLTKQYDEAVSALVASLTLKPDHANTYYTLSLAYKEKKQYMLSAQALKSSLSVVSSQNTEEKQRLENELNDIKKLLTEKELMDLDTYNPSEYIQKPKRIQMILDTSESRYP